MVSNQWLPYCIATHINRRRTPKTYGIAPNECLQRPLKPDRNLWLRISLQPAFAVRPSIPCVSTHFPCIRRLPLVYDNSEYIILKPTSDSIITVIEHEPDLLSSNMSPVSSNHIVIGKRLWAFTF